jgi:hypothetical protein
MSGHSNPCRYRCFPKQVRGRKRHLLVDTEGLVLKAKVHSAKVDGTGDDVVDCGESFVPSGERRGHLRPRRPDCR